MNLRIRQTLETFAFAFSGLLVALAVSWIILSASNFSYAIWHDHTSVGWAIEEYGGQNNFREAFDETSREQRIALFAGITHAINHGGEGLRELEYTVEGHPPQKLLREPEVVHLQDVADLVTAGKYVAVIALAVWLAFGAYFLLTRSRPPSIKRQLASVGVFVVLVATIVVIVGAKDVFYWLHEVMFPENNQWFFYYQDSLMSTMMHAPYLFAWIAVEWVLLAFVVLALLQSGMQSLLVIFTGRERGIRRSLSSDTA